MNTRTASQKAVFLDRDGVLTRSVMRDGRAMAPRRMADFRLLPGVVGAVRALRQAGFRIVVVTNQPDVGHGFIDGATMDAMHARLHARLPLDALEMCPHRQNENCTCRKPKPGMLRRAARRLGIELKTSFMIGDRSSDVIAGQSVGCYTIFVSRSEGLAHDAVPDLIVRSLSSAARHILSMNAKRPQRR